MLNLLFDLSYVYDIVILILIAVALIFAIKFKFLRIFIFTVLFILIVVFSAIAGFNVNNYYSASGGIHGELKELVKPSVEVDDLTFNLQNLTLLETGKENQYSLTVSSDKVLKLSAGEHKVFVNNIPCNIDSYSTDYITCIYDYVFYNEDLEEILNDKLYIRFAFYNNGTSISVTTNGGSEAVNYWNYYFNQNKFIITIK